MNIKAKRIHKLTDSNSKIKGFMDITFDETITVKGFKVVEGKNGLFVSLPSTKTKDKYYDDIRIEKIEDFTKFGAEALALFSKV